MNTCAQLCTPADTLQQSHPTLLCVPLAQPRPNGAVPVLSFTWTDCALRGRCQGRSLCFAQRRHLTEEARAERGALPGGGCGLLLTLGTLAHPDPTHFLQSAFESEVSEVAVSQGEVTLALRNLRAWMKDEHVPKNLATQLDSAFIRKEPFGLVLIIAPWNYPLNLTLVPLVGALAAEASSPPALQSCFAVVLGGPQETGQLLEHRFDYIFFTDQAGSSPGPPGPLRKGWSPTYRAIPPCHPQPQEPQPLPTRPPDPHA
ncbi:hypothetical protein P7K49_021369 [Saguinus oedipus]|uniref:Aldehyde dehydrogenase domain-containing protein n=1 Tax=Saguinus oedipus TaxID=9490 RepID=A0ABQ9USH2_SAGOE|nr:hypothetical protein P7K49_021369 [Saguinus oedipus]